MNKLLFGGLITAFLFLVGCDSTPQYRTIQRITYDCADTMDKRAEFILACIKNANPKSDEEPEDWIELCERMARNTFCIKEYTPVNQVRNGPGGYWVDMSKVPTKTKPIAE